VGRVSTPISHDACTQAGHSDPTRRRRHCRCGGCLLACNCPAPPQFNPVCGSDGVTYGNLQKLNCARSCGGSRFNAFRLVLSSCSCSLHSLILFFYSCLRRSLYSLHIPSCHRFITSLFFVSSCPLNNVSWFPLFRARFSLFVYKNP
jgi:hypothetical protein